MPNLQHADSLDCCITSPHYQIQGNQQPSRTVPIFVYITTTRAPRPRHAGNAADVFSYRQMLSCLWTGFRAFPVFPWTYIHVTLSGGSDLLPCPGASPVSPTGQSALRHAVSFYIYVNSVICFVCMSCHCCVLRTSFTALFHRLYN